MRRRLRSVLDDRSWLRTPALAGRPAAAQRRFEREAKFPETAARRPELVARHYAAAGATQEAIGWWEAAGRQATPPPSPAATPR